MPQFIQAQQASTEGKEFWVALTLCAAPSTGTPEPFIAVSTKEATTVTITNPNLPNWPGVSRSIGANQWEVFDINDISLDKWYPTSANSIANAAQQAGKTNNFGLKVVADKDVSVYAALRMPNSFDAANVLPIHVLQNAAYEYYTQDYPPYIKPSDGEALSMFTVLATENGTNVTITPTCKTHDGKAANASFTIPLNAGQTYYVISETLQTLSGSHVEADKPIAVFQGNVFTQIPGGKAARDCTYEQAMPIDYWGTQFVVTRSKEKDANRIRITSMNDYTDIYLGSKENGNIIYTIPKAGDTYELELYKTQPSQQSLVHKPDAVITEDAIFIESSCPVAVYSYDVSNGYKAEPTEMVDNKGDPSMVWISPLEQSIKEITFGVCGTNKTDEHFIDIVCRTSDINQTTLTPAATDPLTFTPVPYNAQWSYARIHLSTVGTGSGNKVFTLQNPSGVIAHVYGNGDDESYAYSVGSAAVALGSINVNTQTFDREKNFSTTPYCVNEELTFDANAGSTVIDKVDWDFGDGTYQTVDSATAKHTYSVPGWYDVTAKLYAHKECPETTYPPFEVNFTFRVVRPVYEFVPERVCKEEDYTGSMKNDTIWPDETVECSDTIQIPVQVYKKKTSATINQEGRDSALVNGKMYYSSETIKWTTENINGCDSFVTCNLTIITCLDMDIENDSANQVACWGEPLDIQYTKIKGEIDYKGEIGDKVQFVYTLNGEKKTVDVALSEGTKNVSGTITLPTEKLAPGVHHGKIQAKDYYCSDLTMEFPFDITISYPDSIMKPKFGNTIALYQKGKGGNKGWDLDKSTFVWYHDGDSVATGPVYYTPKDANGVSEKLNGEYYVAITTNGKTILSCPKTFKDGVEVTKGSSTVAPAAAPEDDNTPDPAKKVLQNRQIFIVRDGQTFNIYGQKVQ